MPGGMVMPGGWTMSMAWMRMPGQTWLGAAGSFVGMWVVMMVAMMLPSLAPTLLSYRRSLRGPGAVRLGGRTVLVGAGYFFVWTTFGAAVYPFGVALAAAEMRWIGVARFVPFLIGAVLLLAGLFQLTAWKARQLGICRGESAHAGTRSPRVRDAWRHGVRIGRSCGLCCAGFMMILLVTGVMDLGAMAVVTAAISLERLAPKSWRIARAAGVVALAAGGFVIVRALRAT